MPKTPVTFRLDDSLLEAIDAQVIATGSNRTEVVVLALKQFFGLVEEKRLPASWDVIQSLTDRVTHLEEVLSRTSPPESNVIQSLTKRMTDLSERVAAFATAPVPATDVLQRLTERMTAIEQAIASLSVEKVASSNGNQTSQKSLHPETKSTKERKYWFIEERIKHLGYKVTATLKMQIEMFCADAYKERHGKPPAIQPFKKSLAAAYPLSDVDLLDKVITSVMSRQQTIQGNANNTTC